MSKVQRSSTKRSTPKPATPPESGTQPAASSLPYEPTDEQIGHVAMLIVGSRTDERTKLSDRFIGAHPEISEPDAERYRGERGDMARVLSECLDHDFYDEVGGNRELIQTALGTADLHVMRAVLRHCLRDETYYWLCAEYSGTTDHPLSQAAANAQFEIDRQRPDWMAVHHAHLAKTAGGAQ